MKKKTKKKHVLKIKKVPSVVQEFVPRITTDGLGNESSYAVSPLPEPVAVLVEEIKKGNVEEIVFAHAPDPTLWERFKKWFTDDNL